ncbi:MAG: type II toxin-antitoxin system VapC family toxin [Promethearchaeota archaeon]|nr:MAG: type II toxin-antitoxin system VapC family toxin [Candidatus Lokiarchaeota archaeon]
MDTCVFNEKELLLELRKRDHDKIKLYINSIIYLELGYIYFVRGKWDLFLKIIYELGINNKNITKSIAEQAIKAAILFKDREKGASYYFRDCLIGSTAKIFDLVLITRNKNDFFWLEDDSLLDPDQAIEKLELNELNT